MFGEVPEVEYRPIKFLNSEIRFFIMASVRFNCANVMFCVEAIKSDNWID